MLYPRSAAGLRAQYPKIETALYTSRAESTLPASQWTHEHCADIFAIRNPVDYAIPPELRSFLPVIQRRFRENVKLYEEITAYSQEDKLCRSPEEHYARTPMLVTPCNLLGIAIDDPAQPTPDTQREPSTRSRAPVPRVGFVQDMSMVDFGTSDPISSEQEILDDTYTDRIDHSGKQELPVQFYGLIWLMEVDTIYNANNQGLLQRRPQFTSMSRRIPNYIPGAELRCESRDDCEAVWRGPDLNTPNHRMTTLYMPTVLSIEAKSWEKDAFAQWVAELVGQLTESVGYTKMDCDDEASIDKLTDEQRTKFVLSVQGTSWQLVWTTFTVEWIKAFLGTSSPLGNRPRIDESSPEPEPELLGLSQEEDSEVELDDEDVMSGVEQESPIPYLRFNCSRTSRFTEPKERFSMLLSAKAGLQWGIKNEVLRAQAVISLSP